MGPTLTFRTLFARGLMVVGAAIGLVILVYSVIDAGLAGLLVTGPWVVAGVGLTWLLFGNPKVEVSDGGVTVVNILRRVHVPWPCLETVTTRWSLALETTTGTVTSWAIPAASGMSMRARNRRGAKSADGSEALASGHNADAVALSIGERLSALTEAGHLDGSGPPEGISPQADWNVRELAVLAASVVAIALLVL